MSAETAEAVEEDVRTPARCAYVVARVVRRELSDMATEGCIACPSRRSCGRTSVLDDLEFTASCPVCGADCTWISWRLDVRALFATKCPCSETEEVPA